MTNEEMHDSTLRAAAMQPASVEAEINAWRDYAKNPREAGEKIVVVCDDGCSSALALMTEAGPLDGEDGEELGECFLRGGIWHPLPVAYPLAFMERHDDY